MEMSIIPSADFVGWVFYSLVSVVFSCSQEILVAVCFLLGHSGIFLGVTSFSLYTFCLKAFSFAFLLYNLFSLLFILTDW